MKISGGNFPAKKRTWCQKLNDSEGLPKVEKITDTMSRRWGIGTVVIPAPIEVDGIMRKILAGKLVSINEIRAALAKKYKATIGFPMTTGIFAWVAAHAAEERKQRGEKDITPYWHTLKTGGVLNEKYPSGAEAQKELLERGGHTVVQKGKECFVLNYEK